MARSLLTRATASVRTLWRGSTTTPPPPAATPHRIAGMLLKPGEVDKAARKVWEGRTSGGGGGHTSGGTWAWGDYLWAAITSTAAITLGILYLETSRSHSAEVIRGINLNTENHELKERYDAATKPKN